MFGKILYYIGLLALIILSVLDLYNLTILPPSAYRYAIICALVGVGYEVFKNK
ncbi:MAG: hypothetical protein UV69_C0046G0001 [Parcubacteria group bacterium GW2011_GWE2_43_12]|nr:MAG: hypothetical protein UV69_C0046G0001 [Parcubacteria group bacterium GW2011_GWE2_43_12]